jgi:hypothetical protein
MAPAKNKVQSVLNTAAVFESDLMATDEAQPSVSASIEPTSGPVVEISGVNNPIIGGENLSPGSLSEPGNSSSSTTSTTAIGSINDSATNAVVSVIGGKLSGPDVTTTPFAMATAGGIMNSTTNPATTGTDDVVSINAGFAMFLGGFIEKNSASISVGDINTTTNLNATSPIVQKLTKSQKKAAKRKPTSPPEGANATTRSTGCAIDTLSVVPDYDIDFPTSPAYSVTTQKGVTKEKVIPKTTSATTTPVFALHGKAVPNTSASGAFSYEVAKPPLLKSGRVKRGSWTVVGVNSVLLHLWVLVLKPLRLLLLLLVLLLRLFVPHQMDLCHILQQVI